MITLPDNIKKVASVLATIGKFVIAIGFVYYLFFMQPVKTNPILKDYKDGIQNHLTWDIKGQCFFVRPNDDVTVYLIRVTDCDKK